LTEKKVTDEGLRAEILSGFLEGAMKGINRHIQAWAVLTNQERLQEIFNTTDQPKSIPDSHVWFYNDYSQWMEKTEKLFGWKSNEGNIKEAFEEYGSDAIYCFSVTTLKKFLVEERVKGYSSKPKPVLVEAVIKFLELQKREHEKKRKIEQDVLQTTSNPTMNESTTDVFAMNENKNESTTNENSMSEATTSEITVEIADTITTTDTAKITDTNPYLDTILSPTIDTTKTIDTTTSTATETPDTNKRSRSSLIYEVSVLCKNCTVTALVPSQQIFAKSMEQIWEKGFRFDMSTEYQASLPSGYFLQSPLAKKVDLDLTSPCNLSSNETTVYADNVNFGALKLNTGDSFKMDFDCWNFVWTVKDCREATSEDSAKTKVTNTEGNLPKQHGAFV
jgi:hypothetical protein